MARNANTKGSNMNEYEISELPSLGFVTITHSGEENVYFTLADGSLGFVKVSS